MFYSCYCNEELDSIKCSSSSSAAASSPSIVSTTTSSSAFSSSFSRLASPKALSLPLLAAPVHARLIGGYCCFHSTSKASIEVVPHNDQHTSSEKRQTITGFYLYKNNLSSCLSEWLAFQEKWPSGQVAINRPKGPPPHGLLRCCNSQCFCSQSPQLMSGE